MKKVSFAIGRVKGVTLFRFHSSDVSFAAAFGFLETRPQNPKVVHILLSLVWFD